MNKNNLSILVGVAGIVISGVIMGSALAQTQDKKAPADIQFPVKELGNCANESACKVYCDEPANIEACLAFAEKNNLMSGDELAKAKKFKDVGMIGPGGCKGRAECDTHCGKPDNMEECIAFAIKNGMMDPQKQKESQKVLAAIKRGVKLPACNGPKECDKYCSSSEHMEECMNFGIEAGIMDKQKQGEAKKILAAIKRGVKMPACNGQEECDAYCSSSEHMEECITFGIEAGMMPEQDQEKAQKTLAAIKQGIKPPACRGEQECQAYCAQESHVEECIKFGEATGMMKPKDAAMMRKTGGKGPGGCVGKDECEAFCDNPDNQEICFNFGLENDMISEENLKGMDDGKQRMKESLARAPEEILTCLSSSLGADMLEKLKAGTAMLTPKTGGVMDKCFKQFSPQGQMPDDQGGQGGPMEMPGDLKDCIKAQIGEDGLNKIQSGQMDDPALMEKAKTCFDQYGPKDQQGQPGQPGQNRIDPGQPGQNQQGQSGDNFQPGPGAMNPGDQQMPQQAGPGGCKGPEECKTYCESHQEECKNFQPQQNQPGNQIAPGTQQMNQLSPEIEKEMKAKMEEAIKTGQFPEGFKGENFELKDTKSFQDMQNKLPLQQNQQGQFIQGQPGQNQQMIQGQLNQQMQQQGINVQEQQGQMGQPGQYIQGQSGQPMPSDNQSGQLPPPGTQPPQMQQQPPAQQQDQPMPPPPSSFVQKFLGSVLDIFR